MTTAADLRRLAEEGAAALERVPLLEARIAELEAAQRPPAVRWGSGVWMFPGETYGIALARTEAALGTLDPVRYFHPGAPSWPTARTGDRPLHVSFKYAPAEVLTGRYDAEFRAWCAAAPAGPTWWTYFHEPEDDINRGAFTTAQFRAAFRRLAGIAQASGKDLRSTLVLMGWTLDARAGRSWRDYYPGDDVIDVLAWDVYHYAGSDALAQFAAVRKVAAETGKPWALGEVGVDKKVPARAGVLTALALNLTSVRPTPEFVAYFDAHLLNDPIAGAAWDISREPAMARAWLAGR